MSNYSTGSGSIYATEHSRPLCKIWLDSYFGMVEKFFNMPDNTSGALQAIGAFVGSLFTAITIIPALAIGVLLAFADVLVAAGEWLIGLGKPSEEYVSLAA